MTIGLNDLVEYLGRTLKPDEFKDYCPNGLQVEGGAQVKKIATGVTASQALIDQSIAWGADAIVVHHGFFWKGEAEAIVGMKRRRLGALLASNTSLLAYHLPLDAHPDMGNNACFGRILGVGGAQQLEQEELVWTGLLPDPVSLNEILESLARETGRQALLIRGNTTETVQRIAWCTGAAQGYIDAAARSGADLYITGEVSEQTVHTAREEGIHFIAAGHHATERYGVQALGAHLAQEFGLEHRYIEIDNPV